MTGLTGTSRRDGSIIAPFQSLSEALANPRLQSGHTIWLRAGTHVLTQDIDCNASGITIRPYGNERPIIDLGQHILVFYGADVTCLDLPFYSSDPDRETDIAGSDPADIYRGYVDFRGANVVVRGCSFRDTKGVGWWSTSYGIWEGNLVQDTGWQGPDRGHGHCFYTQNNELGMKYVTANVFLAGFGGNLRLYGSSDSYLKHYRLTDNVHLFDSNIVGGLSGSVVEDVEILRALTWDCGQGIGYQGALDHSAKLLDSTIVNDYQYGALSVRQSFSSALEVDGNTVVGSGTSSAVMLVPYATPGPISWNNNTYYAPNAANPFGIDGQGFYNLSNWRTETGYDADSSLTASNPTTNVVSVVPITGCRRLGRIAIYNWQGLGSVNVDLSPLNLPNGNYKLHQVQDYDADIRDITWNGSPVSVAMSGTQRLPVGLGAPLHANTFPGFGCFLVEAA